jgi:hypothetical protein
MRSIIVMTDYHNHEYVEFLQIHSDELKLIWFNSFDVLCLSTDGEIFKSILLIIIVIV